MNTGKLINETLAFIKENKEGYDVLPLEKTFTKITGATIEKNDIKEFAKDINDLKKRSSDRLVKMFKSGNLVTSLKQIEGRHNVGVYARLYSLYALYFLIKRGGIVGYLAKDLTEIAQSYLVPDTITQDNLSSWVKLHA